jgi:hypothetical protein
LFEYFEYRHPIDASRLHGYAAHTLFHQPGAHLTQIGGKTSETPHRLGVPILADSHPVLTAAYIDPGCIRVNDF